MPSTTGPNNADPIRDRLRSDLTRAMRNREQARVTVIRTVLAAIDNAEAVEIAETGQGTVGYADVTADR